MAGNYPALGDLLDAQNVAVIQGIDIQAFNMNEHPTLHQISAENNRLNKINRAPKRQRRHTMTDEEHGAAVTRHHAVATARLNHELGIVNPNNVGAALQAIQDTLNNLQNGLTNVIARLDTLENGQATILARLDTVEAGSRAIMRMIHARKANSKADALGHAFVALPKLVPGHPAFVPQPVNVNLVGAYGVDADPPLGMLPTDGAQLGAWAADDPTFRRRLRTIYWFYNDPRLHIPHNAGRPRLMAAMQELLKFLKEP